MPKISTTIVTAAASYSMVTAPVSLFIRLSGLGHNASYTLFEAGEVDTVVAGGYRLVLMPSFHAYLERQRLGLDRDPVERATAVASYRRSLGISRGARNAARARAGKKKKGSNHNV
jgi:hypothetical protein